MAGEWLVIGLGNPGPDYAATRHNVGQMALSILAQRIGSTFSAHKTRAEVAEGRLGVGIDAPRLILARPRSYMNESGGPAAQLRDFYKVDLDHIIVLHDELDIPFAALRVKQGGGDNGHNGLKSLSKSLGGPEYFRVRIGIGRPPGQQDPAAFVLKPFASTERKELPELIDRSADAVETLIREGLDMAQSRFNS
jgi:peptidyl-tRNA hydrolase, PTH1 family